MIDTFFHHVQEEPAPAQKPGVWLKQFAEMLGAQEIHYIEPANFGQSQRVVSYPSSKHAPCEHDVVKRLREQAKVFDWVAEATHYFAFSIQTSGCLVVAFSAPVNPDIRDSLPVILPLFSLLVDHQIKHSQKLSLLNENNLYRTILDSIPDLISFKTLDGTYQFVNQAARDHYDMPLTGKRIDEVYQDEDAVIVRKLDAEALEHDTPVRRHISVKTKDGYVNVDSIRAQVRDAEGALQGIVSISRDMETVEKHEAEMSRFYAFQKMLAQLASQFINVAPGAEDAAVDKALRLTGDFVGVDRVYVFLYDFDHDMIEYRYEWCAEGISPEIDNLRYMAISDFQTDWVDLHLQDKAVIIENVAELPKDSLLYETLSMQAIQSLITLPLLNDNDCLGFVGFDDVRSVRTWQEEERRLLRFLAQIITNLLVRKRQAEALVASKQTAERANQAKSLFLASISHDIRTPLGIMQNVTELLRTRAQPSYNLEYLGILDSALESLAGLVSNVIDLSKIEAGMMTLEHDTFNLEKSLFKLVKMQEQTAADNGLSLEFDYDRNLSNLVVFDENRLGRIINNLLSNAIKFTPSGSVILRVELLEKHDTNARIHFAIDDHARPITEAEQSLIANRFYRGKDDVGIEGTGLGLSIVVELLKLFDTALDIHRHDDHGNRFGFVLDMPLSEMQSTSVNQPYQGRLALMLGVMDEAMLKVKRAWEQLGFTFTQPPFRDVSPVSLCLVPSDLSKDERAWLKDYPPQMIHQIVSNHALDPVDDYSDFQSTTLVTPHFLHEMFVKTLLAESTDVLAQGKTGHKKVLYVEDNPLSRQTMHEILERRGYDVVTANHAEQAFEMLTRMHFDTILMDVQLPGMDGFEALKLIRARGGTYETIPIFMLTAHALQDDIDHFLEGGATDVLTKPFGVQRLIDVIEGRPVAHWRSKTTLALPKHLPYFDAVSFTKQYKEFMDTGLSIIRNFLQQAPQDVANIVKAFEQRDLTQVAYYAHYFKSSCAYSGAARMAYLCKVIDDAAKERKIRLIQSALSALKDIFVDTEKALTGFLDEQKS
ncbi:MAG: response regulator [Acholeplasmatales bacterium]|nr:MAG: response regulator [Acholeplasmatales bacterium]